METTTINFWGLPVWCLFVVIADRFARWQLTHVWHFHPFIRWVCGEFGQAVLISALAEIFFQFDNYTALVYFMGTLICLTAIRSKNPIEKKERSIKPLGDFTTQDKDSLWMAAFHLVFLSTVL